MGKKVSEPDACAKLDDIAVGFAGLEQRSERVAAQLRQAAKGRPAAGAWRRVGRHQVQSTECRVQSAECRVQSAECRVQSAECRVKSAECKVQSGRVQSGRVQS